MSDQSPPPRPKPGSLRDRIAAFENSSSSAAPAPAPVPRPKPGGSSWKPKSQFPSTFPSASDVSSDKKPSSMFASDAKESIQTGGTLKERMAALQNRGAFSAPAPVVPKPPAEKPKWKPPPVVAPVDKDDDDDSESSQAIDPTRLIPPVRKSTSDEKSADEKSEDQLTGSDQAEGEEAVAVDPEEEEKQRRAAIAARMARLGGARVGMAPMFGRPSSATKPERVDEPTMSSQSGTPAEDTPDENASQKAKAIPLLPTDQPVTATTSASDELTSDTVEPPSGPVRNDSGPSPSLSIEAESRATSSPPLSMPVPSAPRRAAPPRRKAPKTPEAAPPAVNDQIVSISDNEPALGDQGILDAAPVIRAAKEHAGDVQEVVGELDEVVNEPEHPTSIVAQEAEELPPFIAKDSTKKVKDPEEPSAELGASRVATKTLSIEKESFEDDEPSQVVDSPHSPKHPTKPCDEQNIAETVIDDDDDDKGAAEQDISPENDSVKKGVAYFEEHDEKQEHAGKEHVEVQPIVETKEEEPVVQAVDKAEEDEATRRTRITEKLAKIHGGVNPFPPPQRQFSGSSKDIQTLPTVAKRSSTSQSSADLPPLPLTPQRKQTVVPVDQSGKVSSPESALENSPLTTQEVTDEPVEMEKRGIGSEDDTRENSQDGKVPGGLTHNANDGTVAREVPKTYHELVTDAATDVHESAPDKAISVAESETLLPPPPPPPRVPHSSTRPISVLPVDPAVPADPVSRHEDYTPAVAHPSAPRRSLPPPPRLVPEPPESEGDLRGSVLLSESTPLAPPLSRQPSEDEEPLRRLPPRYSVPSEEATDDETPPLPVPNRRSMQSDDFNPPTGKRLSARPSRSIPPPPMSSAPVSDAEDSDFGEALPAPLRQRPATPATPPAQPNEIPLIVPPPVSDDKVRKVDPSPLRKRSYPEVFEQIVHVPPPFAGSGEASSALLSPRSPLHSTHGTDQEVLDEEEGDPIDPSFHSPSRRTSFIVAQPLASPPATEALVTPEENDRAAHPKTIAERMAKLGEIKFGAAPPLPHAVHSPPVPKEEEEAEQEDPSEQPIGVNELTEEEEEQARKERIAAKLAMMNGMRIGMMPLGVGAVRPQASEAEERHPAPPSRAPPARPPSPPQSQGTSEQESGLSASLVSHASATSDEGVKVEIEDSEIEEISQADAQETEEEPEEVPPPVPARGPRRRGIANSDSENSSISPLPPPRSPVPKSLSTRSASIQSTSSMARQSSTDSTKGMQKAPTYKPQSEYVMVEEPSSFLPEKEEEIPPPPPARPSHRPLRTAPPPPPEPSVPLADSISLQWEMPSIPSGPIEFSMPADISLSWPEDSSASSSLSPPPPPPSKYGVDVDVPLSSDDLMTVWGRVGVQICEVATTLFEKSKKSLIGDGTYDGFIRAVLSEVPNAAMPTSTASYGYLIYAQTGNTVQKRASEILPGDIMVLQDAKLKGHKGLQSYHQNVGIGEPTVGVVSEFEPKKSKVRLFQANQHVGQQTVEAVSYRLEDLKSGTVQVFRVLEN